VGAALFKNNASGQTGSARVLGAGVARTLPAGAGITGSGGDLSISVGPFEYNVSTGEGPNLKPNYSIGAALGLGVRISFNPDKFSPISQANEQCRRAGGR